MRPRGMMLWLLFVVACNEPTGAPLLPGAIPFAPLAVYGEWWKMVQSCAPGSRGTLEPIRWYYIPDAWTFEVDGQELSGYYQAAPERIFIAGNWVRSGPLVRHEMLHAAYQIGGHPRDLFVERCGGLVACIRSCPDEEPPPPDASAVTVDPSQLSVSLDVWPASPGLQTLEGYIRLSITVANLPSQKVIVSIPQEADGSAGILSGYRRESASDEAQVNRPITAPEHARFGPGEVRTFVYDLFIGGTPSQGTIPSGPNTFRGRFGSVYTAPVTVTIP